MNPTPPNPNPNLDEHGACLNCHEQPGALGDPFEVGTASIAVSVCKCTVWVESFNLADGCPVCTGLAANELRVVHTHLASVAVWQSARPA